jgi:hypothetical protein
MSHECDCTEREWAINPHRECTKCRGFIPLADELEFFEWADAYKAEAWRLAGRQLRTRCPLCLAWIEDCDCGVDRGEHADTEWRDAAE